MCVKSERDVQPLPDEPWGFTGIFSKENGGGFLDEFYPKPYVLLGTVHATYAELTPGTVQRRSGTSKAFTAAHDISLV